MERKVFICFAAEDRYRITEPIVFHLKKYGIHVWYDRYSLLMGDSRVEKNLIDGVLSCKYAVIVISEFTHYSKCAMEELSLIREEYCKGNIIVFPILYDISPEDLPMALTWIKDLIFKEANKQSGTYEICNHIACKITGDILQICKFQNISHIISELSNILEPSTYCLLADYQEIDSENLNSKVALLYAAYITIKVLMKPDCSPVLTMISCIFNRLFNETKLNLSIDYREIWLLENSICILINEYLDYCTDSNT